MSRSVTSSSTNQFRTVTSSVGFSAGDYVYLNTNGYGRVPDGTLTSATFVNNYAAPAYKPTTSGAVSALSFEAPYGGTNFGKNAAKLTSGNIVVIYFKPSTGTSTTAPLFFKIVDAAGATVVAETQINTTNLGGNGFSATVTATGTGGFAVAWSSSTGNVCVRAYDSAGAATSSEVSIAAFSTSYRAFFMGGRSDGSFIIAYVNSSTQPSYSVYSSTGTSLYTGTWGTTTLNSSIKWGAVTVRSDDSFQLFSASSSDFAYALLSSTNASLGTGSLAGGTTVTSVDAVVGTGNVIHALGLNSSGGIRKVDITGTTPGSSTVLTSYVTFGNVSATFAVTRIESSGGFSVVGVRQSNDPRATGAYYGFASLICDVYDSSWNRLNSSYPIWISPFLSSSAISGTSMMTVNSKVRIYRTISPVELVSSLTINYPNVNGVAYVSVNPTLYAVEGAQTETTNVGTTTSSFPVNLYSRAGSTPIAASFLASASTVTSINSVPGSLGAGDVPFLAQTVVDSTATNTISMDIKNLSNGNFAILYMTSGGNLFLRTYTPVGVLVNSITVSTSAYPQSGSATLVPLSNGKLVVVYSPSNGNITWVIYDTNFATTATGSIATGSNFGSGRVPMACAVGNYSYWAIAFPLLPGPYPCLRVFDDTGASVYTADNFYTANTFNTSFSMSSNTAGEIFVTFQPGSGNYRYATFRRGSALNSYTMIEGDTGAGGGGSSVAWETGWRLSLGVSNTPMTFVINGAQQVSVMQSMSAFTPAVQNFFTTSSGSNYKSGSETWSKALSFTGLGRMLLYSTYAGSATVSQTNVLDTNGVATASVTWQWALTGVSVSGTTACPGIIALPGNRYAICNVNASGLPTYAIYIGSGYDYPLQITAGATSSSAALPLSLANNYSLVGVAVTDCAAGGQGVVQTKGNAVLGSSYSTSISQPFQFQNYITEGRDGIVNGRNVFLQGN
jgi:hypothetical protein